MKKFLYFTLLFLLFASCSIDKQPIFLKVDNIKFISISADTIRLKADAFFENPNDVGGKISTEDFVVFVNDTEVANVFVNEFKVPSRKEFSIPLIAVIPTKKVFENNQNGFLGGLISSMLNKTVKVQFKGNLKYVIFGFKRDFLVDKTQEVKLNF